DNPKLDFIEPIMVFVENASRLRNVNWSFLREAPGQFDQPIEIGSNHSVFSRRFWHSLQPAQFLASLVLNLLWHICLGDRLAQLGRFFGLSSLPLTELALDRRHLLAKQNLALTLVQGSFGLPTNLL